VNQNESYPTTAPKKRQITYENESLLKNVMESSVNKHKEMEKANIEITGDEIKQQNENL